MAYQEKTIAKPLSGAEVIDAMIHSIKFQFRKQAPKVPHKVVETFVTRLKTQMQRDCFLNACISYAVYSSETTVNVNFQEGEEEFFEARSMTKIQFPGTGTGIKETQVGLNTRGGEAVGDKDMQAVEFVVKDSPRAPNAVRVETQQDIPVRVQTPQGKITEKKVRYAQKVTAKAV